MSAAGIECETVIAGHGHPLPLLREGSRDQLRDETGGVKLPALKLTHGTVVTHSRSILAWVDRQART